MPYEPFEMDARRTDGSVGHAARFRVARRSAACTRPVSDDDGEAIVRHAWDIGVRYFDVAPLYGFGEAEIRAWAGCFDERHATSSRSRPRSDG